jgi:hypothetical protein
MFEYRVDPRPPLSRTVTVMLIVWCVLAIPWFPFAVLAGLAFDGGYTLGAYVFVWSWQSYPFLLAIAFFCRRRRPQLIWLPALSIVAVAVSVISDKLSEFTN